MHTKSILFVVSLFGAAVAAGATGCSSSSGGSGSPDSGAEDSSSSGSSGGMEAAALGTLACMSAAGCADAGTNLVCCGTFSGTSPGTACQMGPCPALPIVNIAVQLCATSAECPAGDTCGAPTGALALLSSVAPAGTTILVCNAGSSEAGAGGSSSGSSTEAGSEEGGGSSGSSGGSEASTDAPTGG